MAALLTRGLQEDGYVVDIAATGTDAVWQAGEFDYDIVVLDLMLPGLDGVEVCRQLRKIGRWVPVLMLSARDGVDDRVRGLDAGADDYLAKPFSFAELSARVRALIRRGAIERPTELQVADLRLDPATRQAGRHRARPVGQGVRTARAVPAPPGRGADPHADPRARVGLRLRRRVQRRRPVRAVPAPQGRPAVRRRAVGDRPRRGVPPSRRVDGRRRDMIIY